ncbi:MAG: pyridoxal-phosphate dependent enzyme [Pelolinea sp.]|nr:pyridoxal-phosphate dependent enzyme [Pelolinea sp.]
MKVVCQACKKLEQFDPKAYRCGCGGAWEPIEKDSFNPALINKDINSVWRYKDILGLDEIESEISLGAGWTSSLLSDWERHEVLFKLEYVSPTGSFKDRGTEVEMNYFKSVGVKRVVEDSSGNAGASMAAYAARTGLCADIFAPESASPAKLSQIQVYGAELHRISGPRIESTNAALKEVEEGAVYASHAFNPVYLLGQQTAAWEIWEQTRGDLPDAVVIPVGQCGLLMGMWLGFSRLLRAGMIKKLPRLFAAQPEWLAPIHFAFTNDLEDIPEATPTNTSIAEGLAIVKPVRSKRILQALRESEGGTVIVSEDQIRIAYRNLAKRGFFAEPTSAVAAAAIGRVREVMGNNALILATLTGSGLKSSVLQEEII